MTLKAFIAAHQITIENTWTDANPAMSDMPPGSSHWRCRLTIREHGKRRQMTIPFSQGPAHHNEPTAEDVLYCLVSDTCSVINGRDFADWCAELGLDPDSRKAERIFKACERQKTKLERWIGDTDTLQTLLFSSDEDEQ